MNKTKKLTCVVTGKSSVISGEYLEKKILEYGTEEKLNKMYICKEVKGFLKKGYKIADIRKLLNVSADEELPDKKIIEAIEVDYKTISIDSNSTAINTLTSFTYNRSDVDVENFINKFFINNK
jgi:hypothetical protein